LRLPYKQEAAGSSPALPTSDLQEIERPAGRSAISLRLMSVDVLEAVDTALDALDDAV
jgi:hypothetical protein